MFFSGCFTPKSLRFWQSSNHLILLPRSLWSGARKIIFHRQTNSTYGYILYIYIYIYLFIYIHMYTSTFQVPTNHFLIVWSVRYAQWRALSNPNRSSSQNMHTWLTYPSKSSDQDFRPISQALATQRKTMENPRDSGVAFFDTRMTREWHANDTHWRMKNRATRTKSPPISMYLA